MFEHFAKQIVPESSPKGRFRWGLRGVPLKDCIVLDGTVAMSSRRIPALLGVLCMLIPMLTGSITATSQDDPPEGLAPEDIWSEDYANDVYPWGGNDRIQFKAYHDYFTMRDRMMELAEENDNIMSFHEGLNGGMNARGVETTADDYEGWFYNHRSPWMKITGGGEAL